MKFSKNKNRPVKKRVAILYHDGLNTKLNNCYYVSVLGRFLILSMNSLEAQHDVIFKYGELLCCFFCLCFFEGTPLHIQLAKPKSLITARFVTTGVGETD